MFSLDEEGHGVAPAAEVPAGSESDVVKAAGNCPERAITVE